MDATPTLQTPENDEVSKPLNFRYNPVGNYYFANRFLDGVLWSFQVHVETDESGRTIFNLYKVNPNEYAQAVVNGLEDPKPHYVGTVESLPQLALGVA